MAAGPRSIRGSQSQGDLRVAGTGTRHSAPPPSLVLRSGGSPSAPTMEAGSLAIEGTLQATSLLSATGGLRVNHHPGSAPVLPPPSRLGSRGRTAAGTRSPPPPRSPHHPLYSTVSLVVEPRARAPRHIPAFPDVQSNLLVGQLAPITQAVTSAVAHPRSAFISITAPCRLVPPVEYNAPQRQHEREAHLAPSLRRYHVQLFHRYAGVTGDHASLPTSSVTAGAPSHTIRDMELFAMSGNRAGNLQLEAAALYNLGVVHDNACQFDKSVEFYRAFQLAAARNYDNEAEQLAFNSLGIAYHKLGQLPEALVAHERHAELATHPHSKVLALCNVGLVHRLQGAHEAAAAVHQQALDIARMHNDQEGEMLASGHLGLDFGGLTADHPEQQAVQRGRDMLTRHLLLQTKSTSALEASAAQSQLAMLSLAVGDMRAAYDHFSHARDASRKAGDQVKQQLDSCHMGITLGKIRYNTHVNRLVAVMNGEAPPDSVHAPFVEDTAVDDARTDAAAWHTAPSPLLGPEKPRRKRRLRKKAPPPVTPAVTTPKFKPPLLHPDDAEKIRRARLANQKKYGLSPLTDLSTSSAFLTS